MVLIPMNYLQFVGVRGAKMLLNLLYGSKNKADPRDRLMLKFV